MLITDADNLVMKPCRSRKYRSWPHREVEKKNEYIPAVSKFRLYLKKKLLNADTSTPKLELDYLTSVVHYLVNKSLRKIRQFNKSDTRTRNWIF